MESKRTISTHLQVIVHSMADQHTTSHHFLHLFDHLFKSWGSFQIAWAYAADPSAVVGDSLLLSYEGVVQQTAVEIDNGYASQ